jgi:hypothetical protein
VSLSDYPLLLWKVFFHEGKGLSITGKIFAKLLSSACEKLTGGSSAKPAAKFVRDE